MKTSTKQIKSARMRVELLQQGFSLGSYVTDGEDRLILGSSKQADVVVPELGVSHIHAMLRLVNNQIYVYDLGSSEGTFVGGKKIIESVVNADSPLRIGQQELRVALLEDFTDPESTPEKFLFQNAILPNSNHTLGLDVNLLISGEIQAQYSVSNKNSLSSGWNENEIPLPAKEKRFLTIKANGAICTLPQGLKAEIFNYKNEKQKQIEAGVFSFNPTEKVRILGNNVEVQIYWRTELDRMQRHARDENQKSLQRSLSATLALALLFLLVAQFFTKTTEEIEELTTPKSSYFRLSTEAAAPAAASNPIPSQEPAKSNNAATSVSSVLNKLMQKKSAALSDESIAQAVSKNGSQTTRAANLAAGSSLQKQAIQGGAIGTAMSAESVAQGLQGAGGKGTGKNLNGFAKGGTGVGGLGMGNGAGGNGFNLNVGGEEAEAIGGLDKALIAAVVQANLGQIKHCYEKQLLIDPNIYGKVVAEWVINGTGLVSTSGIKKTTMNNATVENCIASRIKTWKFPQPKGGGKVMVSYPFLFKSLN